MALTLGFLMKADAEQAQEALEQLALKTEAVTAGLEGDFASASRGITNSVISMVPTFGLIAGAIGAVGGALFEMANKASETGEQLALASKQTGVSVEMLQGLQLGAKEAGVSFEQVQRGLAHLSLAMSDLEIPSSEAGKAIAKLGVSTHDANGKLLTMDEILPSIFDAFQKMPEGPEKTAIALELFSRAGFQMLPILDEGSKGLEELTNKAVSYSHITTDVANKDREFQDSLKLLKAQLGGLAQQIEQATIPVVTWLGEVVLHQINAWKQLVTVIQIGMDKVDIWGYKLHGISAQVEKYTQDLSNQRKTLQELVAAENDDGKTVGANQKLQDGLQHELDEVSKSTKNHTQAVKEDADAMRQAAMDAHGYQAQLELMKEVTREAEEHQRKLAEAIHTQIENSKKSLPEEPGGALHLPDSMATLSTQLPNVTLKASTASQAIRGLSQAIQNMSGTFGNASPMMNSFGEALQRIAERNRATTTVAQAFLNVQRQQGQNAKEAGASMVASYGMEAASFIKNKRAQAIVMAIMETAKGLSEVFWNPAAAALDFASAAMYGVIAGTSGGGSSSGGGGGAGGGASQPGAGGQGVTGNGLLGSGSGGGNYHQTIVNMYGGNITDTNNLQQLAAAFNQGSSTGTVRLNVSGTSATIPTPAY
jgi:hypothetical protein